MKRSQWLMMVVILSTGLWLVAEPVVVQAQAHEPVDPVGACTHRRPGESWKCDLERQILASTVRVEWTVQVKNAAGTSYVLSESVGHATVKDGRYLVTHNHLGRVSLSGPRADESVGVTVRKVTGELIWEGPLAAVTVAFRDAETLVFDFGSFGGQGMFARQGLSSAAFRSWNALSLQPGMQVAQVDWDGVTTHVDWTVIEQVTTSGGTPQLKLDNFVREGASGGGVFWNGYHVANNWSQVTAYEKDSDAVWDQYSIAALNSGRAMAAVYDPSVGQSGTPDSGRGTAAQ